MLRPLTDFIGINKEVTVAVTDGATIYDLIKKLVELYGEKLREIVLDPITGRLRVVVLVDGKYGELKTKLIDDSKVVLMIPYAGG